MKKRALNILLISLSFVFTMPLQSQTQQLTLDDLIPGGKSYFRFVPKSIKQLQWMGDEYIFQRGDTLWAVHPAKKKAKRVLLLLADLNKALEAKSIKPVSSLPGVQARYLEEEKCGVLDFYAHQNYIRYNTATQSIDFAIPYENGDGGFDFQPESRRMALTNGKALYIAEEGNKRICVASDKDENITFGQAVHRNEFGITKGTFWSPSGHALAFYWMDETPVGDYPLVDISARQAKLNNMKYPMAGMNSHHVTVGIFYPDTQKSVYLKTGAPRDRYFTNLAWSPDGNQLYIAELNRDQDSCRLNVYDAQSGSLLRTLFTETHPKYVEPEHPVLFLKNNPDQFIWQSERDGFNHLYLYDTQGNLLRQLTQGEWVVTEVLGFDKTGRYLFYVSTQPSALERNTFRLDMKSGKTIRLTADNGVHSTRINRSGDFALDTYSNHDTPRNIDLISIKKETSERLLTASDPYKGYRIPPVEVGTILAADGKTELYYRMVKPADFDPSKKYPVVVYVYGGPHAQMITDSYRWAAGGWDTYMAQRGYILFTVDNRGSDNRGLDFENATYLHLGQEEGKDQMQGIAFLKSLPYVDADRIGVCGWSFGGFMTTNLMLTYPDTYKVGVAGGPVIDWKYYEVMYGERYMGHPKDNKEGYEASNLNNKAGNLKGHLLLIHGDIDPVVVWQHSLSFLKKCVEAGTYPDYFVYPGHVHNVAGRDRVHLQEKITRYFDDYLK